MMATLEQLNSIDFIKMAKDMNEASKKRINLEDLEVLRKKLVSSIDKSAKVCEEKMMKDLKGDTGVSPKKKQCLRKQTRKKSQKREPAHTNGAIVSRGLDEGKINLTPQECIYLERRLPRIKKITDLNEDQLRYLITVKFVDHLQGVKNGTVHSDIHEQFLAYRKSGETMQELYSDIKTSLFTRGQVDYIQGCLQGKFYRMKDGSEDVVKFSLDDIDYISTVLFNEIIIQIVMLILKKDIHEAQEYMTTHALANDDSSFDSDLE